MTNIQQQQYNRVFNRYTNGKITVQQWMKFCKNFMFYVILPTHKQQFVRMQNERGIGWPTRQK